jgi:hypothetical protein
MLGNQPAIVFQPLDGPAAARLGTRELGRRTQRRTGRREEAEGRSQRSEGGSRRSDWLLSPSARGDGFRPPPPCITKRGDGQTGGKRSFSTKNGAGRASDTSFNTPMLQLARSNSDDNEKNGQHDCANERPGDMAICQPLHAGTCPRSCLRLRIEGSHLQTPVCSRAMSPPRPLVPSRARSGCHLPPSLASGSDIGAPLGTLPGRRR